MAPTGQDILPHRGKITALVMLATVMQVLDTTIANVAIPYMQGSLNATLSQVNWVLTSYIVAAAIMTPPTGWLAARFGRKRLFLLSVLGFTVTSVLCGLASSLEEMVVFRVLQGMFGAPLVPLSQAVMLDSYPKEKVGQAMAIWGIGVMVGPIMGPTLGGWLTEYWDWRWVFFINVPFGIITFLGLAAYLGESRADTKLAFDWFGFFTLSIAIGALQMMLDRGEQLDWFSSTEVVAEAVACGLGFYLFLVHILTAERPFITPTLFLDRNFSTGLIFMFLLGVVLLANLALLTPFLQSLLDYPVFLAGLILAPRGVGTMIVMMLIGRFGNRLDPRVSIALGYGLIAYSLWVMTGVTLQVPKETVIYSGFVQGLGIGLVFSSLNTVTFATLAPRFRNEGTALFNLMRNIGSSVGIAVVIYLLTRNAAIDHAYVAETVNPFAPMASQLPTLWDPSTLTGLATLNQEVTRQAMLLSYLQDFQLLMWMALASIPLVLMLQRPEPKAAA